MRPAAQRLPGPFAPAGEAGRVSPRRAHSLSFASPKKSKQKKGDPTVCDPAAVRRGNLRQTAIAGGPRKLATLKHARPCPGHRHVPQAHTEGREPTTLAFAAPLRSQPLWPCLRFPHKSGGEDGRVFERSEFAAVPTAVGQSQGHPPQAGHGQWGRLSLVTFFGDPKESNSPAGAQSRHATPAGRISRPSAPPGALPAHATFYWENTRVCSRRNDHQTASATTGIANAAVRSALKGQPTSCAPLAR